MAKDPLRRSYYQGGNASEKQGCLMQILSLATLAALAFVFLWAISKGYL